jgi:hypothetical protein
LAPADLIKQVESYAIVVFFRKRPIAAEQLQRKLNANAIPSSGSGCRDIEGNSRPSSAALR